MAKSKLVKANEKIADAVVNSYKKVEDGLLEDLIKLLISLWRTFLQNMVDLRNIIAYNKDTL